jgi:hypothetical protein
LTYRLALRRIPWNKITNHHYVSVKGSTST